MYTYRRELRPFGISVHIVEPGPFKTYISSTDVMKARLEFTWNRLSEEKQQEYGEDYLKFC